MKPALFAALTVALVTTPVAAQDRNLGRNLAAQCANCHGTNGANQGGMPSLAGMSRIVFTAHMNAFKSGARSGPAATIMHQLAKGYNDEQIAEMAAFFAAQKPAK